MSDKLTTTHRTKRRGLRWKISLGLFLLLILAFAIFRITYHQSVAKHLTAIRDAGYPITPEELNAWYPYPEGPNAADLYQQAFELYAKNEDAQNMLPVFNREIDLPDPGEPLPKDLAQRIQAYLADNKGAISLLEQAAKIEGCRYPVDFTEGVNFDSPTWAYLRHGTKLLSLQSIMDGDQGKYNLAANRCITIISLARSLENEPYIISSLVSISNQLLAYKQIEFLVNTSQINDDHLSRLAHAVSSANLDRMQLRAMVGERCYGQSMFNDPEKFLRTLTSRSKPVPRFDVAWSMIGLKDFDYSSYLARMQAHVDYSEDPSWPIPPSLDDEEQLPRLSIISRIMIPALPAVHEAFRRMKAKRQTLLAGIATERYRQQHNQFPAQLTDLVPDFLETVPQDPFDNQPLRYHLEDAGAIIYSVGVDGTDNDGRKLDDKSKQYKEGTDITFTFGGLQEKLWPGERKQSDEQR
jgi:hypothetical protein